MSKGWWTGGRGSVLLAALVLLASAGALRAAEKEPSEFNLVPADAAGFVIVRPAEVLGTLGISPSNGPHLALEAWEKQVGFPVSDVKALAIVFLADDGDFVCVLQGTGKLPRKKLLAACSADGEEVKHEGRVFHVGKSDGTALHFVSDSTAVVANNKEILAKYLKRSVADEEPVALDAAVELACRHHFVAWVRTSALPKGGRVSMPASVKAGTLILDVGKQVTLEARIHCTDAAGAQWGDKVLRFGAGMVHLQAGMASAMSVLADGADLFPEFDGLPGGELKDKLPYFPMTLIRQAVKGLENPRLRREGTTAVLSVSVAIDARTLRTEMQKVVNFAMKEAGKEWGLCLPLPFLRTRVDSSSLAAQREDRARTAPIPDLRPPTPIGLPATPVLPVSLPDGGVVPGCPPPGMVPAPTLAPIAARQMPRAAQDQGPPTIPVALPLTSTGVGNAAYQPPTPSQAPTPRKASGKLTVANVRKEAALLFRMTEDGKLSFVRKLPPGEAVDVEAENQGHRWVAVFPDNPAGESFDPSGAEAVWLLR
jgi:hypothetical protein